jgi:molybdopterin-containing oxidoreductase family membrane subunit
VPGFIPTPLGEVFEYTPTPTELLVSIGIWAFGAMVFTLLAKSSIAIELGRVGARRVVDEKGEGAIATTPSAAS